jgi:integrase
MSRANAIYSFEKKIANELQNIQEKDSANRDTILRYHKQRIADGISLARQHKCLCTLKQLSKLLEGKQFESASKEDIIRLMARIEQKQDFSPWTKRDYKVVLKTFYQWLFECEKGEHPPLVKWIRSGYKIPTQLRKSDLLTSEEIVSLMNAARTQRDRTLMHVLWESGRRLGEILTLQIGDVTFDAMGARLTVDGKMGRDYSRIIESAPGLLKLLENHPLKNNTNAPVWLQRNAKSREFTQLRYETARKMLRDCAQIANIQKKRVWFYLFRHSRGTFASTRLNAQQLCALMGWTQGSAMASVYIHLANDDIDRAQAILNEIKT